MDDGMGSPISGNLQICFHLKWQVYDIRICQDWNRFLWVWLCSMNQSSSEGCNTVVEGFSLARPPFQNVQGRSIVTETAWLDAKTVCVVGRFDPFPYLMFAQISSHGFLAILVGKLHKTSNVSWAMWPFLVIIAFLHRPRCQAEIAERWITFQVERDSPKTPPASMPSPGWVWAGWVCARSSRNWGKSMDT